MFQGAEGKVNKGAEKDSQQVPREFGLISSLPRAYPPPSLLLPFEKGKEKGYHRGIEHKENNADKNSGDLM